jgi:hypothetical protein
MCVDIGNVRALVSVDGGRMRGSRGPNCRNDKLPRQVTRFVDRINKDESTVTLMRKKTRVPRLRREKIVGSIQSLYQYQVWLLKRGLA